MGRRLIKSLETEINKLHSDEVIHFVKSILLKCSDYNADMPASSTGKYHPIADQGPGGLIRHVKAVCLNTETILKMSPQYDDLKEWDAVYAAAILHDFGKYTEYGQQFINDDHPRIIAECIRQHLTTDPEWNTFIERVAENVECHMSRWNKCKKSGKEDLPTPKNMENMIVAIADMISSQKYFNLQFDENNEIKLD